MTLKDEFGLKKIFLRHHFADNQLVRRCGGELFRFRILDFCTSS